MDHDFDIDDFERCYLCAERGEEVVLRGDGVCPKCGISADAPASRWARAVADGDPDGFQGKR